MKRSPINEFPKDLDEEVIERPVNSILRDQASDSDEVVTPLMLDGTYLSRNFATLGPLT